MQLLIISLAGIGDTMFATPLIHELRANFPESAIDAFVLWKGSLDVLEGNPHLNQVHQKNLLRVSKPEALSFLWQLRKRRYDYSFNTHPQSRIHYQVVARIINARVRVSHQYHRASGLDGLLVNRSIPQDYAIHSIENNLRLLPLADAKAIFPRHDYEIYLTEAELGWAEKYLQEQNLTDRPMLGIHIGSGGTKNLALRRWPLDSYLELIQRLNRARPDLAILLFGGPEEEADHQRLLTQAKPGSVLNPPTRNLRQAASLIRKCCLFLSVDTALMHVAAAMKVPRQVVIETPTWNLPIQPYNNPFTLVPNPAVAGKNLEYYRYDGRAIRGTPQELVRCMQSVKVEAVLEALIP